MPLSERHMVFGGWATAIVQYLRGLTELLRNALGFVTPVWQKHQNSSKDPWAQHFPNDVTLGMPFKLWALVFMVLYKVCLHKDRYTAVYKNSLATINGYISGKDNFMVIIKHLTCWGDNSVGTVLAARTGRPEVHLQNPHKKLGVLLHACNPSTEGVETVISPRLAGHLA